MTCPIWLSLLFSLVFLPSSGPSFPSRFFLVKLEFKPTSKVAPISSLQCLPLDQGAPRIWKVWSSYYSDIIQNLNSHLKKLRNGNIDHFWPPFSHGIIFLAKLWLVLTRQGNHVQIHEKTLKQGFSTFFQALRYPRYGILVFDCTLYKSRSHTKWNMVNSDTEITSLRYPYGKPLLLRCYNFSNSKIVLRILFLVWFENVLFTQKNV